MCGRGDTFSLLRDCAANHTIAIWRNKVESAFQLLRGPESLPGASWTWPEPWGWPWLGFLTRRGEHTSAVWRLSHRGHLVGWSRIESGADHTQIGWSRIESGADHTQRPTGDARTSLKCRAQSNAVALVLAAILKSNAS